MVNYHASLDRTFSALADPVRRAMLMQLRRGDATVKELGAQHALTLPAVLKHVRYLESAGLLTARKEGRARVCHLAPRPLASAVEWLEHYRMFWDERLDSLERFLAAQHSHLDPATKEEQWKPQPKRSRSKSNATSAQRPRKSSTRGRGATR